MTSQRVTYATGHIRHPGRLVSTTSGQSSARSLKPTAACCRPANNFHLCLTCLQTLVLAASLTRRARDLAIRSQERWLASQRLLNEVKSIALDAA